LEEKKRYLEHHWILAGKELDQEKILRQKVQKEHENDYERALQQEKEKCIKLRKDYEKQFESTKKAHSKQCEELGREVLKANLEADRLHNQLVGAPRQTRLFCRGTSWKDLPIRSILISMGFAVRKFGISSDCLDNRSLTLSSHSILSFSCSSLRVTRATFSPRMLHVLR
jgi:hypothetical protein